MSECRLETGDCDERRSAMRAPLPFPAEMVKLEDLSFDPQPLHHSELLPHYPSKELHPSKDLPLQGQLPLRAQYISS